MATKRQATLNIKRGILIAEKRHFAALTPSGRMANQMRFE
jgi:hypothetical protein